MLDLLDVRQNLIAGKLVGGLRDLAMLVSKIFRRENFLDVPLFNEEAAAGDAGFGNRCCRHRFLNL